MHLTVTLVAFYLTLSTSTYGDNEDNPLHASGHCLGAR